MLAEIFIANSRLMFSVDNKDIYLFLMQNDTRPGLYAEHYPEYGKFVVYENFEDFESGAGTTYEIIHNDGRPSFLPKNLIKTYEWAYREYSCYTYFKPKFNKDIMPVEVRQLLKFVYSYSFFYLEGLGVAMDKHGTILFDAHIDFENPVYKARQDPDELLDLRHLVKLREDAEKSKAEWKLKNPGVDNGTDS